MVHPVSELHIPGNPLVDQIGVVPPVSRSSTVIIGVQKTRVDLPDGPLSPAFPVEKERCEV